MKRILFLALLFVVAPAWAADFCVSPTGTDGVGCGACGAPGTHCRTPNGALAANAITTGNRMLVSPGTYSADSADTSILSVTPADVGATILATGPGVLFSGLESNTINDANWAVCDASANCNGDGTTSTMVFRQSVSGRIIRRVYDLTASGAHSSLFTVDCGSEPMKWTWEAPIALSDCATLVTVAGSVYTTPWQCVQQLPHTYWVNGSNLLVHFSDNETSLAAAQTSHNIETSPVTNVISITTSGVTVDGIKTQFSGSGAQVQLSAAADNAIFQNGESSSGGFNGLFVVLADADSVTLQDWNLHDAGMRPMCTAATDSCPGSANPRGVGQGYCHSSGTPLISGSSWLLGVGTSSSTITTDNLTVRRVNVWNGVPNLISCDQCNQATYDTVLAKNAPNHTFYIQTGGAGSAPCTGNTIRRAMAFNGQDGIVLANSQGCTDSRVLFSFSSGKSITNDGFYLQASNTGSTYRGNLTPAGIVFDNFSGDNASSNRNWLNNSGTKCRYSTTAAPTSSNVQCTSGWGNSFDANSLFGSSVDLKLAGFNGAGTWPPATTVGLTASTWTRATFAPLAGSPLIDAGGLDYDGDRADDDACNSGNGCAGAAFDIGPVEFGLAAPSDTTAPSAPSSFAAGSPTATTVPLSWVSPGDDATTGTATTYTIRGVVGACTAIDTLSEFNALGSDANVVCVGGTPTPQVAGTSQSCTATAIGSTALVATTAYCFAMTASDEVPNQSALSATASATTAAGGTGIACTEAAFETALAACQDITFNCAAGTDITVKAGKCSGGAQGDCYLDADCTGGSSGTCDRGYRRWNCTGKAINGEDKVRFVPSIKWWQRSICDNPADGTGDNNDPCDTNSDGSPDFCPATADAGQFLIIDGSGNTIKNLTMAPGFVSMVAFNGIGSDPATATGVSDNIVENVHGTVGGDEAFTNEIGAGSQGSGGPNIVRGRDAAHPLILQDFCDKVVQMNGRDTDLSGHTGNDLVVGPFVTIKNSADPLRANVNGRYKITQVTLEEVNPPSLFSCSIGPRIGDTTTKMHVEIDRLTVNGCKYGMRIEGAATAWIHDSAFTNSTVGGLSVTNTARVVLDNTIIQDNGGTFTSGSPTGYGGLSRWNTALVEAGTGGAGLGLDYTAANPGGTTRQSVGGNLFEGNTCFGVSGACDANDNATGALFLDEDCWGDQDPTDQIKGTNAASVDYLPLNATCAGPPPSATPRVSIGCRGCDPGR